MGKPRDTANLVSNSVIFPNIANQRVGIGTNNPTQKLEVVGSLALGTQINKATLTYTTNTARTLTIPNVDENRTFAFIDQAQTFSGNNTFSGTNTFSNPITVSSVPFYKNSSTISSNYTIGTSFNEMSIGPITISTGATVTVQSGARWVII